MEYQVVRIGGMISLVVSKHKTMAAARAACRKMARIAGAKTLSVDVLQAVKALGFSIKVETPELGGERVA